MHEVIATYIAEQNQQYATGKAHEHSYRLALQNLIKALLPKTYRIVNEPTRETCGAPDFIILKGDVPIAYIETSPSGRPRRATASSAFDAGNARTEICQI